jgi:hypothetical protein
MKLSPSQIAQAVAEARLMIKEHDPVRVGLISVHISTMVTDDQLAAGAARMMAAVTEEPTP